MSLCSPSFSPQNSRLCCSMILHDGVQCFFADTVLKLEMVLSSDSTHHRWIFGRTYNERICGYFAVQYVKLQKFTPKYQHKSKVTGLHHVCAHHQSFKHPCPHNDRLIFSHRTPTMLPMDPFPNWYKPPSDAIRSSLRYTKSISIIMTPHRAHTRIPGDPLRASSFLAPARALMFRSRHILAHGPRAISFAFQRPAEATQHLIFLFKPLILHTEFFP